MAEENGSGKIVLELDLETGKFTTNLNQATGQVQEHGNAMNGFLKDVGIGFLELNAVIEVGQKLLEAWHKAFDIASEAEKMKNQEAAFHSFATNLNVDTQAMVESIKKATGGTVTELQAMNSAMDLLQAGVNGKQIPSLSALAQQIVATGHHGETFEGVMRSMMIAIETGSARGLRQYSQLAEVSGKFGDRQTVINEILEAGTRKMGMYGDQIDTTMMKIKARSDQAWESTKKFFGGIVENVAFAVFADGADKAVSNVKKLEDQLNRVDEAHKKGQTSIEVYVGGMAKMLPIAEAHKAVEEELAKAKAVVSVNTKKESDEEEALNKKLETSKTFQTELLPLQKQRAEMAAQMMVISQKAAEEEETEAGVSLKTLQDLAVVKKSSIEKEYNDRKQLAEAGATNEKELANKLVDLEKWKYNQIRAIRTDDTRFKNAEDTAMLNITTQHMHLVENAQAQHEKIMMDSENKRYQVETEKLRMSGLQGDQLNKKVESQELSHQENIKRIKDRYNAVNTQNFNFGVASSLQSMQKQYGSFTAIVDRGMKASQNIMTKSFVEAAKGHGNAMEMMKSQFLEMIGTEMIQEGTFHMLKGVATLNPAEVGAGVALVAAGSALVGASASSPAAGGGSSDFSTSATTGTGSSTSPAGATATELNKSKAAIVINGDFLNSRETANHLADVLRQNSDVTDYTITAQGKNYG